MAKTYAQLSREIAALQSAADKVRQSEVKTAIAQINEAIAKYGLNADDFRYGSQGITTPDKSAARSAASAGRGSETNGAAKFSDGEGNTWSGRGPRPKWLRDAIADGSSLESFLAAHALPSASAVNSSDSRSAKRVSPAAGKEVVAKYRDPSSGSTWSGRGSQPGWLKAAVKKGRRLGSFLIAQPANESTATSGQVAGRGAKKSAVAKAVEAVNVTTANRSNPTAAARKRLSKNGAEKGAGSAKKAAAKSSASLPVVAKSVTTNGTATSKAAPATGAPKKMPSRKASARAVMKVQSAPTGSATGAEDLSAE